MFTKMFGKAIESAVEQGYDKTTGLFWVITGLSFLLACIVLFGVHCLSGAMLMVIYNTVRHFIPQLPTFSYWFFVLICFAITWVKTTFSK